MSLTRTRLLALAAWAGVAVLGSLAAAQPEPKADPPPAQPQTEAGVSVYRQVLKSTVWVHSDRGGGVRATGSGSLIDRGRRLVLTNYHVVGNVRRATVYFPAYEGKKVVPERKYYLDRSGRLGIPGEVVELDREADLALIRIDRTPDDSPALQIADESPDPGQTVHSIGNPGRSGALWVYTPGKVRQVYSKKWKAKLDERTLHTFDARIVETDSPTNPGDSGGPLVNDKGQLVGVTEGGATDAQLLSLFVDVSEVKRLLRRRSVVALRSGDSTTSESPREKGPARAAREKPLEGQDRAKLFGEAAWKALAPAAERLLKEKKADLLVETYETPPKGDAERVKAMTAGEKEKYFRQAAEKRVKDEKLAGVFVLICKTPSYLYVDVSEESGLSRDSARKLRDSLREALIGSFKEKKFDDGLAKASQIVLEAYGLGEKK